MIEKWDEKEFLNGVKKFRENKTDFVERRNGERRRPVITWVDKFTNRKGDRRK